VISACRRLEQGVTLSEIAAEAFSAYIDGVQRGTRSMENGADNVHGVIVDSLRGAVRPADTIDL
jgi:hypothetical protein